MPKRAKGRRERTLVERLLLEGLALGLGRGLVVVDAVRVGRSERLLALAGGVGGHQECSGVLECS